MIEVLNRQIMMLRQEGKFQEAISLAQRLLKLCEDQRGADDPETLTIENNFAVLLEESGQLEDAEVHFRHSLQGRLATLGREHEDTAMSYNSLANLLFRLDKKDEAKQCSRQAYETRDRLLGPDSPKTLTSMQNLLMMHLLTGEPEPARELLTKGIPYMRDTYGEAHPMTRAWQESLARLPG